MKLGAPALATLRYFQRGHEIARKTYWLPNSYTPQRRLAELRAAGLLEQPRHPLDLWRITRAGLAALKEHAS
jgi:hypothetical protein